MRDLLVQGMPHLLMDDDSVPARMRLEERTYVSDLIQHGVSRYAGEFYKRLRLPPQDEIYLLDYRQADIDFAVNYLMENPWVLAHVLHREEGGEAIYLQGQDDILQALQSRMNWTRHPEFASPLYDAMRILAWPGHRMPFRRKQEMRRWVEQGLDRGILDRCAEGWAPLADPQARFLLSVNHWRVLVDLPEQFVASVDDQGKTVQCKQFEHRYQMAQWIVGVAGEKGEVRLIPWNGRLEMPKLSILGGLRDWVKHLCEVRSPEEGLQGELDLEGGMWGWLDGQAAFCEPVRHRMQGYQQDRPYLRVQILMHQTGGLVHPGFPGQGHRLTMDAPAVEVYRPLNPFAAPTEKDANPEDLQ